MGKIQQDTSVGILMDSKVMIEKDDYITSGILSFAEGDIMEIELSERDKFKLGDSVRLSIYSLGGIHVVHSQIIAIDHEVIILINPPEHQRKFLNRREHPRVGVKEHGKITALREKPHQSVNLKLPVRIEIMDISVGGIGFRVEDPIEVDLVHSVVDIQMDSGVIALCTAKIVRCEEKDGGALFFGAEFKSFPQHMMNALRAYILTKQIHKRVDMRKMNFKSKLQA